MNRVYVLPDGSNIYSVFGKIAWLYSNSQMHRKWSMEATIPYIMPPIELRSFCLLEKGEIPVAYCSWARFDLAVETKYLMSASSLQVGDWCSGNRIWFIDWISPFGIENTKSLKAAIEDEFAGEVVRALRVWPDSGRNGRVTSYKGRLVSRECANALLRRYFDELEQQLVGR